MTSWEVERLKTQLAEVARGAFQAVVNVASSLLNQLLTVAQEVVGQIAHPVEKLQVAPLDLGRGAGPLLAGGADLPRLLDGVVVQKGIRSS